MQSVPPLNLQPQPHPLVTNSGSANGFDPAHGRTSPAQTFLPSASVGGLFAFNQNAPVPEDTVVDVKSPLVNSSGVNGPRYSFYEAEYYRHYFDVSTRLVIARLYAASVPWINNDLSSSPRQRHLRRHWSPNIQAAFSQVGQGQGDLYGWFWVMITATFWLFFASSLEQSYLFQSGDILVVAYDLTDLWLGFCLLLAGNIGWPLLAFWLQPTDAPPTAATTDVTLESQLSACDTQSSWIYWVSMYGYTRTSLLWYTLLHFFMVLIFGKWTSTWLSAFFQWLLLLSWIFTEWCYLINESYSLYYNCYGGSTAAGDSQFAQQLKNIPLNYHFCFLLIFEGLLSLFVALCFSRF